MEIRFLTQPNITFAKTLKEHLGNYQIALIAIAYITEDGIREVEKELLQKSSVKILCGTHGCISDLPALKNLVSQSNNRIDGRVYLGTNVFHPKLYIFQDNDNATLLVGSSNLTGSGLHINEEAIVEITGSPLSQPIVDAIKYFGDLWNTNSVSIEKYLHEYPDYLVRQNQNENLTFEQKEKQELMRKELRSTNMVVFKNQVNKTLLNKGVQTTPIRFNYIIDSFNLCELGKSVYFDVILPNGQQVPGEIYYGLNNTEPYYQIKISRSRNIEKLTNQISINDILEYKIDLTTKIVRINKVLEDTTL